jgi:hypothetical protein
MLAISFRRLSAKLHSACLAQGFSSAASTATKGEEQTGATFSSQLSKTTHGKKGTGTSYLFTQQDYYPENRGMSTLSLTLPWGSRSEAYNEKGFARLLKAMAYKVSETSVSGDPLVFR